MSTSIGEATRWFYVREGRRHGPVETPRLIDLVLGGEIPEEALVWHSGLPEWLPARDVEEIRRELPPPLPTPPLPGPGPTGDAEASDPSAQGEGMALAGAGAPAGGAGDDDAEGADGQERRRKRKHRHRDSKRRPAWLWPLVVVLVGLMIFLWWLLRRMNEVPPGRIIQTGSLYGGLSAGDADGVPSPRGG